MKKTNGPGKRLHLDRNAQISCIIDLRGWNLFSGQQQFYHVKLHCYVVIDLKLGELDPRDEGQLRFYVNAVEEIKAKLMAPIHDDT